MRDGSPRPAARKATRKIKQYYSKHRSCRRTQQREARSNTESVVVHQTPRPEEVLPVARAQLPNNNNYRLPQPELPVEVWHRILRDMYPSQLTQVALTSRLLYRIVECHPLWRSILTAYPLRRSGDETETSNFVNVLSQSRFICERCYGHSDTTGSRRALPVFIESERKNIRLCIRCRQAHFDAHPEPSDGDADGADYRVYGGRVGLAAEVEHLRQLEEENGRNMLDTSEQRRRMLEITLVARGLQMDESQRVVSNFISNGNGRDLQEVVYDIIMRRDMNARREDLEHRLQEVGLHLRNDSRICQAYIRYAVGNIDSVVTTMVEMDWLFRATVYRRLIGVADHIEEIDSEDGSDERYSGDSDNEFRYQNIRQKVDEVEQKTAAIVDYIHQRLRERRWNDVSNDEDTLNRPPRTLWPRIRTLSRQIWLEQTKGHYLGATVRRFESLFLTVDPMNTDSLSNELLKRSLDYGAMDATHDNTRRQQNPLIPFSAALETFLGEEEFGKCLNVLRQLIFHRVGSAYVENALRKDLPYDISSFITACNTSPGLTLGEYNARKSKLISERIPFVAAQEKVHICYVIRLLDALKEIGHIRLAT